MGVYFLVLDTPFFIILEINNGHRHIMIIKSGIRILFSLFLRKQV